MLETYLDIDINKIKMNILLHTYDLEQSKIKTNMVKKECYLIRQDNTIYKLSIYIYIFKYRTRQIKARETNTLITSFNCNSSLIENNLNIILFILPEFNFLLQNDICPCLAE